MAASADAHQINVRFWHKADMLNALTNVHFEGNDGHDADVTRCLLMTQNDFLALLWRAGVLQRLRARVTI